MTPIKNYEKLYSFPEVWKAIFLLIYGGGGNGGGSSHKKGIGDSEMEELQDILYGIMERLFYPKSFPKVWRALRYLNKRYNPDGSSDDSSDSNSDDSSDSGDIAVKKEPVKVKVQEEP